MHAGAQEVEVVLVGVQVEAVVQVQKEVALGAVRVQDLFARKDGPRRHAREAPLCRWGRPVASTGGVVAQPGSKRKGEHDVQLVPEPSRFLWNLDFIISSAYCILCLALLHLALPFFVLLTEGLLLHALLTEALATMQYCTVQYSTLTGATCFQLARLPWLLKSESGSKHHGSSLGTTAPPPPPFPLPSPSPTLLCAHVGSREDHGHGPQELARVALAISAALHRVDRLSSFSLWALDCPTQQEARGTEAEACSSHLRIPPRPL